MYSVKDKTWGTTHTVGCIVKSQSISKGKVKFKNRSQPNYYYYKFQSLITNREDAAVLWPQGLKEMKG